MIRHLLEILRYVAVTMVTVSILAAALLVGSLGWLAWRNPTLALVDCTRSEAIERRC